MVHRVKGQTVVVYACAEHARSVLCRWYHIKDRVHSFRLKCTESSSNIGEVRFDWIFGPRESALCCILAEASDTVGDLLEVCTI